MADFIPYRAMKAKFFLKTVQSVIGNLEKSCISSISGLIDIEVQRLSPRINF